MNNKQTCCFRMFQASLEPTPLGIIKNEPLLLCECHLGMTKQYNITKTQADPHFPYL